MSTNQVSKTVEMVIDRETRGSVLYKTGYIPGGRPIAQNIYIAKDSLPIPYPVKLRITIETID